MSVAVFVSAAPSLKSFISLGRKPMVLAHKRSRSAAEISITAGHDCVAGAVNVWGTVVFVVGVVEAAGAEGVVEAASTKATGMNKSKNKTKTIAKLKALFCMSKEERGEV